VSVVLDAALMRHETINCHPLVNTMTTSIARADLVRPRSHRPSAPDRGRRGTGGAGAVLSYRLQTPPLTPFNWPYSGFRRGRARLSRERQCPIEWPQMVQLNGRSRPAWTARTKDGRNDDVAER